MYELLYVKYTGDTPPASCASGYAGDKLWARSAVRRRGVAVHTVRRQAVKANKKIESIREDTG